MPDPSRRWDGEADTTPRMRDDSRARQFSRSRAEHTLDTPTLSQPEEEEEEESRDPSSPTAPHTEAVAAGLAPPPLPPRRRQMFIFSPVGSEMLSHAVTSYQTQIIAITCLATIQPAARKRSPASTVLPGWSLPLPLTGGQEPPNPLPRAHTDGKGSEGTQG